MGIKVAVTVGVSMAIIAALILSMTNPTAVGPLGVLTFFACTYLFFVCLFFVLIVLVQRITARFVREKNQIQLTNTKRHAKGIQQGPGMPIHSDRSSWRRSTSAAN